MTPKAKKKQKKPTNLLWAHTQNPNHYNPEWNEAKHLYTGTDRSRDMFSPVLKNFIKEEFKFSVGHKKLSCCSEKFSVQNSIEELSQERKHKCLYFYNTWNSVLSMNYFKVIKHLFSSVYLESIFQSRSLQTKPHPCRALAHSLGALPGPKGQQCKSGVLTLTEELSLYINWISYLWSGSPKIPMQIAYKLNWNKLHFVNTCEIKSTYIT